MAPLNVEVFNTIRGDIRFDTRVGPLGKVYPLTFTDMMNLIRNRCGFERKSLEFKP